MIDEWDWPPRRQHRTQPRIDGRVEREAVVLTPRRSPSFGDRAADVFFRAIVGLYRAALVVALVAVALSAAWLIIMILSN